MTKLLDPDEIFLDSSNLPAFDAQQFEGQIERPISKKTFYFLGAIFLLIGLVFLGRSGDLQLRQGVALAERGAKNTLRSLPIFAERGIISDRYGVELAWNDAGRHYITKPGFGHILGYIGYPNETELKSNQYGTTELIGRSGVEKVFDNLLRGENGIKIEEVNALGQTEPGYILKTPTNGHDLRLSIDSRIQEQLNHFINDLVAEGRFNAGAGAIMDIHTGELIALTNVPEYDPNVLSGSKDSGIINNYLTDARHPFLNRALAGLYTPGSIVKPYMALAALTERTISPDKKILSTGELVLPNPYDATKPSIFKDWKAHGWVDMRQALAVSSNVYFYTLGGGFGDQAGIGIRNIAKYAALFGLGHQTGIDLGSEEEGVVPTPEWKAANFKGEAWRIGDTYHTVIGQYGFQVTPIQIVRAVASIATNGQLVTPTVVAHEGSQSVALQSIPDIRPDSFKIVKEGMRQGVLAGTASGLNVSGVAIAAKTGTAELGLAREEVNSWVTGFFPYDEPRYAFTVVMEKAKRNNLIGATFVMRQLIDWMVTNTPEYFQVDPALKTG